MKTSLSTLEGLKRSLKVELPIDTFNQKTDKILQSFAKKARIDGFRKGKIPATILRQRFGLINSVDEANSFGILIGEKPGQMRRNLAIRMKRLLEKHGRKGYLLALDHISPDLIDFYPVDAYVNTACPRIAIDDSVRYAKPLITPYELEVALGEKKWETGYQFDEIP